MGGTTNAESVQVESVIIISTPAAIFALSVFSSPTPPKLEMMQVSLSKQADIYVSSYHGGGSYFQVP